MKVKCIKDTIGFKKGEEFIAYVSCDYPPFIGKEWKEKIYFRDHPEYFQEVKEEETKKPRDPTEEELKLYFR